jgi:glycosyltransferase involved in cell wall biosynthesis
MKALTFFNFIETVIHTPSENLILQELNIPFKIIKNINYDKYDIVVCDYQTFIDIKEIYSKKVIFAYNDKIKNYLKDYDLNNICFNENSELFGNHGHLSHNILLNLDDNKYYYYESNNLYLYKNNCNNQQVFFINNKYIENMKINDNIYINQNINIETVIKDKFPYKIIKYDNKYFKKYNNNIQEINIKSFKNKLNNIVDSIYISNENIHGCEIVDNLEIHFTIMILSYNNEKYTDLCLKSALNQKYKNFDVLFINCNSNDNTRKICEDYEEEYDNLTIIDEIERVYQTENFLLGTLLSKKNTTIVSLDGDDWLNSYNVLNLLNDVYFSTRCLMTYGSYTEFPYRNIKWAWTKRNLEELSNIRKNKFSLSHLRTWNKNLFLNIKQESLKINNKYPEMAGDVSVLLYLVEMFPNKCIFINKQLYVYNRTNVLSDSNINENKQIETAELFFNKEKYQKINIENILELNNPLLFFINELPISYLKFSMINKYLKYKKSKFICKCSYKIFKNTDYINYVHSGLHRIDFDEKDCEKMKLFFNKEKFQNYKLLKNNNLYEKYSEKKINKLGIVILSCKKRLKNAVNKLENFKKSNINAVCKIFVGDETIKNPYEENDIVYLKVPDNYESLPIKVHRAMHWYIGNHDVDYIFKTDDDINIDFNKLYELFEKNISNQILYCGNLAVFKPFFDTNHFGKCENDNINNTKILIDYYGFYVSGGGYFVSVDILKKCLDNYIDLYYKKHIKAEDLLMGIVINKLNILPVHIDYSKILNWGECESSYYYFYIWRNLLATSTQINKN